MEEEWLHRKEVVFIDTRNDKEIEAYSAKFNKDSFWTKLASCGAKIGKEGVYTALLLYYALASDKIPVSFKALVLGALAYTVIPVDALPDFIPIVGYTDDLAVLAYTRYKAERYLDTDVVELAKNKVTELWKGAY